MTTQEKPIGVGIIGANPDRGWAKDAHIPALAALPQFRLAAVSTSRAESAALAGAHYGVPSFHSAEALVACPDVDLVAVTVKVPQHRELVMAALNAGKNVYCEWPLGNGTAEARELADLAEARNVKAFAGLQGRFNPVVQEVIKLLRAGYVGQVLSTSIVGSGAAWGGMTHSTGTYLSDAANGATMLSIPIGHTLDAICQALGEFTPAHALTAIRRAAIPVADTGETITPTAPDQIAAIGAFADGVIGSIHYRGGVFPGTNLLWEINGTQGDLRVSATTGHLQMSPTRLHGAKGFAPMEELPVSPEFRPVPDSLLDTPACNVALAYAQVAEALAGRTSAAPTFRDAVRRHEMLDRIEAAAG